MVTTVEEPTGVVLTVKVAVVPPAGTVTLAGTVAAPVLLLDRLTTAPPLGAGALSVTVPVEELPPVTLDGLRLREESVGGVTVSEGVRVAPLAPEVVAMVDEVIGDALTVLAALVLPARNVTLAGTVAAPV